MVQQCLVGINVQLVGDADLAITNCVVRWPGSVHDARIFMEYRLFTEFQTNRPDGILSDDSAYPLLPWVMIPFPTPNTSSQMRCNNAQGRTSCGIEHLNGVLKRHFACLKLSGSRTTTSMEHNTGLYCATQYRYPTQYPPLWHRWSSRAACSCWWSRPTCGFSSK